MLGFARSTGLSRAVARATRSHVRTASTVGGALEEAVVRLPHKEALRSIKQEIRWSFQELQSRVDELANGFQDLKFAKGDVLAVWLPNNAENVLTQLAAAKAGLTLAVIEPEVSTAAEIEFILQDSKASGILFEPKINGRNQTEIIQSLFPELETFRESFEVFRPKRFRHLHSVITTGFEPVEGVIQFSEMMVNSPEPYAMAAVKKTLNEQTPLAYTYSKVAGQNPSKGEVITHGELLKRASELAKSLELSATDKILLTGEESGISFAPLAAIEKSSQIVLPSAEYDHEAIQHAIKLESCSVIGSGSSNFKRV